jgi:ADP-heptose:LPS heptosyltransferase
MAVDTDKWQGKLLKSIEIGFKRLVLQIFRLCGGIKKAKAEFDPNKIKKVLFIRHDKLGDMIVSLPIFHNLRRLYPNMRIDVVCGRGNYEIVKTDPHITRTYYYHKKPLYDLKNVLEMRKEKYDCVVDLIFGSGVTNVILTALIAGPRFKFGVGKLKYAKYYDRTYEFVRFKRHIIDATGSVLKLFGVDPKQCDMRPRMNLDETEIGVGKRFVEKLKEKYEVVLCVNLSVGHFIRSWPVEKFHELVGILQREYTDWAIVLNYAPSERYKADHIISDYKENVVAIPSGLNIRQVAGMMGSYDFLITPDTSLTHIASSFDLPSMVMYPGSDDNFNEWGPYNPKIRAIRSPHPDRIEQIEPQAVFEAFRKMVVEEGLPSREKAV